MWDRKGEGGGGRHLVEERGDRVVTAIQDEQDGGDVTTEIKQLPLPQDSSLQKDYHMTIT